jgi:hypothetical protein
MLQHDKMYASWVPTAVNLSPILSIICARSFVQNLIIISSPIPERKYIQSTLIPKQTPDDCFLTVCSERHNSLPNAPWLSATSPKQVLRRFR